MYIEREKWWLLLLMCIGNLSAMMIAFYGYSMQALHQSWTDSRFCHFQGTANKRKKEKKKSSMAINKPCLKRKLIIIIMFLPKKFDASDLTP